VPAVPAVPAGPAVPVVCVLCSEHYATISLRLKGLGDETELSLDCKGVPSGEEERTREGWKRYYFMAIKQTFGYGASLY